MRPLVMLIVLIGFTAGVAVYWSKVSKERRDVLARLDRERAIRPDFSPTAELFRSVAAERDGLEGSLGSTFADDLPPAPASPAPGASPAPFAPPTSATTPPPPPPFGGASAVQPTPSSVPAFGESASLPPVFHGLVVPSDFVPVQPGDGERAVYATDRNAALVRDQLQHLLREVELGATWVEPTVATVVRGMASGLVTIYPHAGSVRDLDGSALFPTARPDETVVRFSAT